MTQGGPFAVLFVFLLMYVMKNNKEREDKSIEREEKLMKHLSETTLVLNDINTKLERMEK